MGCIYSVSLLVCIMCLSILALSPVVFRFFVHLGIFIVTVLPVLSIHSLTSWDTSLSVT
uniref:Uncharacterized protein n=1 Tax=Tetranychus urticae TaxID=32264 RepID=T1KW69_TETUR